ncbi:MAG: alpha-L-glutamate ligase-like protein [Chloroflexota bacterium]|nr:alpha-L-glutamate ligase-like protein [Chloroflexota bacterium]
MGTSRLWGGLLGMNLRSAYVSRENPARAIRLVNSKHATKLVLQEAEVPTVPTIVVVRNSRELLSLDWDKLPGAWALKPDRGCQGAGILLAHGHDGEGWRTGSGRHLSRFAIADHVRHVLEGESSMADVDHDMAIFESLVVPHELLAELAPWGLPDLRVICYRSVPVLAMMRLPTLVSEGRANLHQGAVGAGIDLESGTITSAMLSRKQITQHPDTGRPLLGVKVPHWEQILSAASISSRATGLGYSGVDVVIDRERGPLVIEVNARPGLEIQNVNGDGLLRRLQVAGTRPTAWAGTVLETRHELGAGVGVTALEG